MLRRIRDRNIWLLYGATVVLGLAYGLAIALIGLFLDNRGYDKPQIGWLAWWFALGTVCLALPMGSIIRRLTAKRVLVVCFLGYACTVSAFPHLGPHWAIVLDRYLDGAFSVGIWIASETILLQRADADHKAFIMSLYGIAIGIGYVVGPVAAGVLRTFAPFELAFATSGVLATCAGLLVALRLERDPVVTGILYEGPVVEPVVSDAGAASGSTAAASAVPAPDASRVLDRSSLRHVLAIVRSIRCSCFGAFSYGYFQSSIVLFMPLFLRDSKGIPEAQTVYMFACFAAGLLAFSSVAGRIADRVGHLLVMRLLALAGGCLVAGFLLVDGFVVMCVVTFLGGAVLASISPISLALQGGIVDPRDYSRANSIYNTFYAGGTLVGPVVSSYLFAGFGDDDAGKKLGGEMMMLHLALLWGCFALFTLVFRRDDPRSRRAVTPAVAPAAEASS